MSTKDGLADNHGVVIRVIVGCHRINQIFVNKYVSSFLDITGVNAIDNKKTIKHRGGKILTELSLLFTALVQQV